ncbi:amidohydrolase [Phenylobacterium sp.]|uniref:amidohydrolase family protein n=1 Tax=Phenylobacterium sp. TaxID=1871053 RepID=UPI00272F5463|nr:amidohydrolase family protein [Phenylobacterium sp.]MDP1617274.1 amidohydrolase family protein [Phenylobacterium sp.]MDP1985802.1 amidohydrolase family protein [Phenylobacterium sp.]
MSRETILEPELPIVDPHHHLWDMRGRFGADAPAPRHGFEALLRRSPHYLLDQLLGDLGAGHNVRATIFVECGAMYRAGAPAALAPVGETEFVNGVAAMSASGLYGEARACAGIVGHVDLTLGDAAAPVIEAHLAAGGGRFRGVRQSASYDPDAAVLGPLARNAAGLYRSEAFRAGFAHLADHGLSFDAWLLEPQLPDLMDLASAFPETTIILDHVGTPLGIGAYAGQREARFEIWRDSIRDLAERPNVVCKVGGLAMPFAGFPSFMAEPPATSAMLAEAWRPYVETTIEAFGASRCMFESNFPVDAGTCDYATLWNAFKRLAAGASADEKAALFHDTARRIYRLEI